MATIPKSRNQIPSPRSKIQGSNWFQALLFVVAMSLHLAHHESFEIIVKKHNFDVVHNFSMFGLDAKAARVKGLWN